MLLHSATAEACDFVWPGKLHEALMLFTDCSTHERPVMRLYHSLNFSQLQEELFCLFLDQTSQLTLRCINPSVSLCLVCICQQLKQLKFS